MSDTVTKPTPAMLEYMLSAPVGDDVFGEDPTVNALQQKVATMFAMEDALFCPSGTMTNQIALQLHSEMLDEFICELNAHLYQYETGGYAHNARCAVNLIEGKWGKITGDQVKSAIKPLFDWLPRTRMVSIENTCNRGGGTIYTLAEATEIFNVCQQHQLAFHLDGARIFNALVETGESSTHWGPLFDTISICLSKGLGAPVGSLLIGSKALVSKARRLRKVMGGGMRQAGIIAAAGIFALDHHIPLLREDHRKATALKEALISKSFVKELRPVQTNIVIAELVDDYPLDHFIGKLEQHGIRTVAFGKQTVRMVTHLDISDSMINYAIEVIGRM